MWGLSQRSRSIVSPGRAQLIRGCRNSTRELVTRGTGCLTWGLKLEKVVKGVQTLWREKLTHELGWLREQRCSESPLKNACVHAQSLSHVWFSATKRYSWVIAWGSGERDGKAGTGLGGPLINTYLGATLLCTKLLPALCPHPLENLRSSSWDSRPGHPVNMSTPCLWQKVQSIEFYTFIKDSLWLTKQ